MSTTFASAVENPYLVALETAVGKATGEVQWLVFADTDVQLRRRLGANLPDDSSVLLELPQERWNFNSAKLIEMINGALELCEIQHLVLAGSSKMNGFDAQSRPLTSRNDAGGGAKKLLANLHRRNEAVRLARQRFAGHLKQVSNIPMLRQRCDNGELTIHGLFFQAESGLCFHCDPQTGTYCPLDDLPDHC